MKRSFTLLWAILTLTIANAQISFQENIIIDNSKAIQEPQSVVSADIDGDGDMDIVVGSYRENKVVWYENLDGMGNFGIRNVISENEGFGYSVISGDIDNDGDIDIVASSINNDISWFENTDGLGTFVRRTITSMQNGGSILELADIDGDGNLDVIAAGYNNNSIGWYGNTLGDGTFSSKLIISNNVGGIRSINAGDIDNDGDVDLGIIYSPNAMSRVAWLENINGFGNFNTEHIIQDTSDFAVSIVIADVDGDNDLDALVSYEDNSSISFYENIDGLGNYQLEQQISTSANVSNMLVADIDSDGDNDIVWSSKYYGEERVAWHQNNGQGFFANEHIINTNVYTPLSLFVADVNGDGSTDVISASINDNKVAWYDNEDGQGNFGLEHNITGHADEPRSIKNADIDGDGFPDVVSASSLDDKIAWYRNLDGLGNFSTQKIITASAQEVKIIDVADMDGDGDNDIVAVSFDLGVLSWYENLDGLGTFGERITIAENQMPDSMQISDIDNDGDQDILVAGSFGIAWFENIDGLGSFSLSNNISTMEGVASVFAADLDGDGDLDVISGSYYNLVTWFENTDGQGNFGPDQFISSNFARPTNVFSEDMDGDGDMDVVAIFGVDNKVVWFENDGLGTFDSWHIITDQILFGRSVFVIDLDADGDVDVISASVTDNKIAWYENIDGLGNFGPQQIISTNAASVIQVLAADMNGDGAIDVLSASVDDDKISWYKNTLTSNLITGNIKADIDNDGCDPSDYSTPNILVEAESGTQTLSTFTNQNGRFLLYVNEGEFTTAVISGFPTYYSATPEQYDSNFIGIGSVDTVNFCLFPTQTINDLNISYYSLNEARPGFEASYQIVYHNVGTTTLSGWVELVFDETKSMFLNASEPVSSQTANSLTFNYAGIQPFETRAIDVEFYIMPPPTTEIGDILDFMATVNPISGDYNENDNIFNFDQILVGSFDPNDIQVLEGEEISEEETDNYLHYIIRFQNTGTADAINVSVQNDLDPNLDWTTIQLENMSHRNRVGITNRNQVEFKFDNINLPASTINEPESHGYIQYKIKPKSTIQIGESISNTAQIFFDFNPAIVTNTVVTTVVEHLAVQENVLDTLSIYPVPATDFVLIKYNGTITRANIYNELGQLVLEENDSEGINSIKTENLSKGIYFIKLRDSSENEVVKKLIKN